MLDARALKISEDTRQMYRDKRYRSFGRNARIECAHSRFRSLSPNINRRTYRKTYARVCILPVNDKLTREFPAEKIHSDITRSANVFLPAKISCILKTGIPRSGEMLRCVSENVTIMGYSCTDFDLNRGTPLPYPPEVFARVKMSTKNVF